MLEGDFFCTHTHPLGISGWNHGVFFCTLRFGYGSLPGCQWSPWRLRSESPILNRTRNPGGHCYWEGGHTHTKNISYIYRILWSIISESPILNMYSCHPGGHEPASREGGHSKVGHPKRKFIFQPLIFRGENLSFSECISLRWGYIYAVLHSNITTLDEYCDLTPKICGQNLSNVGLPWVETKICQTNCRRTPKWMFYNGCFIMEKHIKMDHLGVPLFLETCRYLSVCHELPLNFPPQNPGCILNDCWGF